MNEILNCTLHSPTEDLIKLGVIEPELKLAVEIRKLLLFPEKPDGMEVRRRALKLAGLIYRSGYKKVLLDSEPPYLITFLVPALKDVGIKPVFLYKKLIGDKLEAKDKRVRRTIEYEVGGIIEV